MYVIKEKNWGRTAQFFSFLIYFPIFTLITTNFEFENTNLKLWFLNYKIVAKIKFPSKFKNTHQKTTFGTFKNTA